MVEILVGAGGGKPPRFKVQDAGANMIGFIGDDSAGFVGAYFQRLRVAPSFASSQRIEANASGVVIENVPLSIAGSAYSTAINTTDGVKVTNNSDLSYTRLDSTGLTASQNSFNRYTLLGWGGIQMVDASTSRSMTLQYSGMAVMGPSANPSVFYGQEGVSSSSSGAYVSMSGSGSYARFNSYRFGDLYSSGTGFVTDVAKLASTAWIPSSLSGSEDLAGVIAKVNALLAALSSAGLCTGLSLSYAAGWWPVYDAFGSYVGKCPYKP